MPKRVIFDTDPGVDDAMALFLLLRSPELELEAVTTVYGNVDVEQATRNALICLDVAGRPDIPVAKGADRGLMRRNWKDAAFVHGDNGLGGITLPEPSRSVVPQHAAQLIVERVMASPGEITLIAVGRLTNIALAVNLEPRIVGNVRELIVMGGAIDLPGNVSPVAEANIGGDPDGAQVVFSAGFPLVLHGTDVASKAIIKPDAIEQLRQRGGKVGEFIHAISAHYSAHYARRRGQPGFPMYDTTAVVHAIDPGYFQSERWYIEVETASPRAAGTVMADRRGWWGQQPNADVCMGIDTDGVLALYLERLSVSN